MSRPMLLMQESLLSDLWYRHSTGVPILTLIKQEQINITAPTLTKLINYMTQLENIDTENELNEPLYETVYLSLFPSWLEENELELVVQPHGWFYEGLFPLGKWIQRNKQ